MSVVGEVVGIVACVAAVVSAYRDGGQVVQKIKARRAARCAPPPPRLLEESIDSAPDEIEREKCRGVLRFGAAFKHGDSTAVIALQAITIQLQGSLLEKLRSAAYDDEVIDFTGLVDASDLGRDRSIAAMLALRQRLLEAESIRELSPRSEPEKHVRRLTSDHSGGNNRHSSGKSSGNGNGNSNSNNHSGASNGGSGSSAADDQHHGRKHRQSALFNFLRNPRLHSSSHDEHEHRSKTDGHGEHRRASVERTAMPFKPSNVSDGQPSHTGNNSRPHFTYSEGEDDPSKIWANVVSPSSSLSSHDTVSQRHDARSSVSVAPDQMAPARNHSITSSSPSSTTAGLSFPQSRRATSASITSRGSIDSAAVPQPTAENNYLGFCKGAVNLQNGHREAMQKQKEFNDGFSQSTVYCLSCEVKKCAFTGKIPLDVIWTKVWLAEDSGVKFRWPFLAKSHVCQPKVKNHRFLYRCLFCAFSNQGQRQKEQQPVPVFHGTDPYLDHVSREHRGEALGAVVLHRTGCINHRVCDDAENFDVNLFPLTAAEALERQLRLQTSQTPSGDALAQRQSAMTIFGEQESILSDNPWNEGLSEFHYGDEMERVEKE